MTDNVIMVQPMMPGSTKAPIEGTTFPDQAFVMSASFTPTGGSASTYFQGINFSKSGSVWVPSTSKYWPKSSTTAFLAASFPSLSATAYWGSPAASSMTLASSGNANTIPDNRTVQSDIMYAGTGNITQSSGSVALQFKHALALLKFTGQAYTSYNSTANTGVTIESITMSALKYQGKLGVSMSGNTVTASWTMQNTTGSATAASGSWGLPETGTVNIGSGYLVMPQGAVAITINYTMHKGGSNSSKSYTFTPSESWAMATAYTYAIFIDQDAVSITATATVDDWQVKNVMTSPGTFGGLMIAPGDLIISNGLTITDNWYDAMNITYASRVFAENGLSSSSYSDIISDYYNLDRYVSYDGYDDWHAPHTWEWEILMGTSRPGATVNGTANMHYAFIRVTESSSTVAFGWLLFPDGEVITGKVLAYMDNGNFNNGDYALSRAELDNYLNQGCAFFPAGDITGYYFAWESNGNLSMYALNLGYYGNNLTAIYHFELGTAAKGRDSNYNYKNPGHVRCVRTY